MKMRDLIGGKFVHSGSMNSDPQKRVMSLGLRLTKLSYRHIILKTDSLKDRRLF